MFSVLVKVYLSRPPDAGKRLTAPLALGAVDDVKDGHGVEGFVNVVVDDVGIGQAAGVCRAAGRLGEHARHEGNIVVNGSFYISDDFIRNPRHTALFFQVCRDSLQGADSRSIPSYAVHGAGSRVANGFLLLLLRC